MYHGTAVAKALEQLDATVKEATTAKQQRQQLEEELAHTGLALQQAQAESSR